MKKDAAIIVADRSFSHSGWGSLQVETWGFLIFEFIYYYFFESLEERCWPDQAGPSSAALRRDPSIPAVPQLPDRLRRHRRQ